MAGRQEQVEAQRRWGVGIADGREQFDPGAQCGRPQPAGDIGADLFRRDPSAAEQGGGGKGHGQGPKAKPEGHWFKTEVIKLPEHAPERGGGSLCFTTA